MWTRQRLLKLACFGIFGAIATAVISQFSRDNLISERDIDYSQLRDLLKGRRWSDANRKTRELILKLCWLNVASDWFVNGEWDKNKFKQDIDQIPCMDLLTIDQLWAKYSNGKFGYSTQKNIYLDVGSKVDGEWDKNEPEWDKFATSVGWKQSGYDDEQLTFDISAPRGHLPACWWFGGLFSSRIILRLEKCKNTP